VCIGFGKMIGFKYAGQALRKRLTLLEAERAAE